MSSEGFPPGAPQPGPPVYQPPHEPNISAKMLLGVLAAVVVVIVAIVLVIALTSGGGRGGSGSPSAALNGYADGINDGDMRAAMDHTILKFMPNYDDMLSMYDNISFDNLIHLEFSDMTVVYNSSMSLDQQQEAADTISEINLMLDIQVQDSAFVQYTMTMEYPGMGTPMTFSGEMLCVEVGGHWYIAMLSFPDMFEGY